MRENAERPPPLSCARAAHAFSLQMWACPRAAVVGLRDCGAKRWRNWQTSGFPGIPCLSRDTMCIPHDTCWKAWRRHSGSARPKSSISSCWQARRGPQRCRWRKNRSLLRSNGSWMRSILIPLLSLGGVGMCSPGIAQPICYFTFTSHARLLRAMSSGDASFQEVIEDLQRVSSQFRVWWEQQDVRGLPDGPRAMDHPTLGALEFDHVTFQTSIAPDLRVKVYAASSETASKLEQALCASS